MKISFTIISLLFTFFLNAQTDSLQPPYKRFPTPPPFKLLMTDSSTFFTKADLKKKTPLFIMVFSPDCDHCKHETEELIKNIDRFKKIQILLTTWLPFDQMKKFYEEFQLSWFENITVAWDKSFFIAPFYGIQNLPFLAFYDKNGKLISGFQGSLPMDKVAERFGIE
jgi:thioredoxin-related protein